MIEPILKWLFGPNIQMQVDLGNLSVGLATMLVALVSIFVARNASKANNRQKIAEFRRDWIERLRSQYSEFIGTIHMIRNLSISVHEGIAKREALDEHHAKIMMLENQIKLYLNPQEDKHASVIAEMAQIRGMAAHFSLSPSSELVKSMDESIDKANAKLKEILKTEWDRTTQEMLGRKK